MKTKKILSVLTLGIIVSALGQNTLEQPVTTSSGCISEGWGVYLNNKQFQ